MGEIGKIKTFCEDKETNEILKICNEFLQIPSVISHESCFLKYLNLKIKKLGFKTKLRKSYLAIEPKKETKTLLSAHVDRHGCVKDKKGRIQFASFYLKKKYKILSPRRERAKKELELARLIQTKLKGIDVFLGKENLKFKSDDLELNFERKGSRNFYEKTGQNYSKCDFFSYNIKTGKKIKKYRALRYDVEWKQSRVWFDLDTKPEKNEKVFMLESEIMCQDNKRFFAQIDNVLSVSVLFYMLKKIGPENFKSNVLFTTQEEIGRSYNSFLEYSKLYPRKRFELVVLDTTPYDKFPLEESFLVLRKGDERGKFNLKITRRLKNIIKNNNIKFRFKQQNIGKTELGAIITNTRKKIVGTTLQIPTTNYHTAYETTRLKDLENFKKVVEEICTNSI